MAAPPEIRDFEIEIDRLAAAARQENDQRGKSRGGRGDGRRPSWLILVGLGLVALEAGSLGIFYMLRMREVSTQRPPQPKIATQRDCAGEVHRAYWKIVSYVRDRGRPPASLAELVPDYVPKPPADPKTGSPLEYSTDGTHFAVRCAGPSTDAGRPARG
jgi:hypothetical protein